MASAMKSLMIVHMVHMVHIGIIWELYGIHMELIWRSYGIHMEFIWFQPYELIIIVFPERYQRWKEYVANHGK